MFDSRTYTERRRRLQAQFDTGVLLFLGNEESPMNYAGNTYHFRQDSTFLYYFGLNQPGLAAVIDVDNDRATVYGTDLTIDDIVWTGPLPTVAEQAALAGVEHTAAPRALDEFLQDAVAQGRPIHFLPPYRAENQIKLYRWLGIHPDRAGASASVQFIRAVVEMRAVKSAEEIEEIEKAVNVCVDMHLAGMRLARAGMTEAQIMARVTEIALNAGGGLSFPVIATTHGETLHNHFYGHTLRSGDLFLLDAGHETARGYAGDLTSTFPVDGKFAPRQRELYDLVIRAQEAAVGAIRPGVPFREVHLLACRTLAAGLKEIGLMQGDVDEAVAQGAHAMFFQCGLGHMMGLDVHDMEDLGEVYVGYEGQPKSTVFGLKSLRLARPLKPGFVMTVEPGVYIIPALIDQWKAAGKFRDFIRYDRLEEYRNFGGIRNEDDYVVTADGCRRLGKGKPTSSAEVEAVRGQA